MSLRRRLLVALLSVVLLSGVVASAATYYAARTEVGALLDEELRQVALSMREHATVDLGRFASPEDPERRVVVQIWDRSGFTVYLSNARTPLPLSRTPGFSTLHHEGREWRMYTLQAGAQTIQAAQSGSERTQRAAAAALRVLVPVVGALPLLAVLVWLVLERGLAPLERLAGAVRRRSPAALEPIAAQRVPEEIEPLVSALNQLLGRLGQAFAAQRRFAADAAHELRTPLTALALHIQLAERARTEQERRAALQGLRERVQRATRVVQQLLVLARIEPESAAQASARVRLDELARAVLGELAPVAAEKPVSARLARAEAVSVLGHDEALRILLVNLLDNAIRYTPAHGHVELRAFSEGDDAVLEVADDGPGVPAAERERVFDRFYRGAEVDATGSGLGLAIARQVAELHGGRIELGAGLNGRGLRARFAMRRERLSSA